MPLARYAVYRGGPQIWVAPTADDSDGWLASMRHIAIESGAFVVSVPQFIPGAAFPDDFPVPIDRERVYGRGGAAIVEPVAGRVIEGPLYDREGMVVADCDLREGLHAKRWFDAVGHYSREDVLLPLVDGPVPRRGGGEWCRSHRGTSGRARPRRSCSVTPRAPLEHLERVEVEVVGRLVEQQQVGLGGDDRGDRGAGALARAEALERAADRVSVEAEVGEQRARPGLVDAGCGLAAEPRQQRAGGGDVLRALGEQADARGHLHLAARSARACRGGGEQGRLAGTVRARDRDPLATVEGEVDVAQQGRAARRRRAAARRGGRGRRRRRA